MKTLTLSFLFSLSLFAADKPPELTDTQKLAIVSAQRDFITKQAEKNALESRLKDLDYVEIPKAQKAMNDVAAQATPAGYQMQADLTLKALPKIPAPAK